MFKTPLSDALHVSPFKQISEISDIQPVVADKKEIRFNVQPNGVTIGCYQFMDSKTFDSPEALECRGIAFGVDGRIVSRPLHKFFNAGEKDWLSPDKLLGRTDVAGVFDKLDGSMIATALVDGQLLWRSKKAFTSDVVKLTQAFVDLPENAPLKAFATVVAELGLTAIFELTHPEARIVVAQDVAQLRLLHVRDNVTGEYVLLDDQHAIHGLIEQFNVPRVPRFDLDMQGVFDSLETMCDQEGYVVQFTNGDMVKIKCPWYQRLHRSVTFLRERDIALLALNEELDDVKSALKEAGIDLDAVNEVESRLKQRLIGLADEVEAVYAGGKDAQGNDLDRKAFALAHQRHPLFSLAIMRYQGREVPLTDWFIKNRLKDEFGLRVLANDALAEALEG